MKNLSKFNIFSLLLLFISINVCAQEFDDGVLRYRVLDEEEATCEVIGPVASEFRGDLIVPQTVSILDREYEVISIAEFAFYEASFLTSVVFPETLQTIGRASFTSSGLQSLEIPQNVTLIGNGAFGFCSSLKSITLPEGIIIVDDFSFYSCDSLESIKLPSSLIWIGNYSFAFCNSLNSIILPESMSGIDPYAFFNCDSLDSITMLADHYVVINRDRFCDWSVPVLYVKENLIDEYNKSEWTNYSKKILPIPMDDKDSSGVESITVDKDTPFDIYNLSGMLIRKNAVKTDISGLNSGVYILKQGDASQRIMIH